MRIFTLGVILLGGLHLVSAQAPFTGGAGDGYDRATLALSTHLHPSAVQSWRAYPQPAQVGQAIELSDASEQPASWELFDLRGKSWQRGEFAAGQRARLETEGLLPGQYFLRVSTEQGITSHSITLLPR
jgi:hypothetical protein